MAVMGIIKGGTGEGGSKKIYTALGDVGGNMYGIVSPDGTYTHWAYNSQGSKYDDDYLSITVNSNSMSVITLKKPCTIKSMVYGSPYYKEATYSANDTVSLYYHGTTLTSGAIIFDS